MSIYRISAEVDDLPLEDLNKVINSIHEQYGIQLTVVEVDPSSRCCSTAIRSEGWHHNTNCVNYVLVD